jgi:hypothetical protein
MQERHVFEPAHHGGSWPRNRAGELCNADNTSFWFGEVTNKREIYMNASNSGIQSHISIAFPIKSPDDAMTLAEELPPLMPDFSKPRMLSAQFITPVS